MVKEILTAAGFVENETFKATRFVSPPNVTYAVYFDAIKARGADNLNLIAEHTATIEVYSYTPIRRPRPRSRPSLTQSVRNTRSPIDIG